MKQKTGSFIAVDPSGKKHTINIITNFINTSEFGGSQIQKGLKELKTQDGIPVSRVEKGHYLIMTASFTRSEPLDIYSDDPDAP